MRPWRMTQIPSQAPHTRHYNIKQLLNFLPPPPHIISPKKQKRKNRPARDRSRRLFHFETAVGFEGRVSGRCPEIDERRGLSAGAGGGIPLSRQGMLLTYLDHAGSTLPSKKQLDATFQELSSPQSPFSTTSNPHSTNSALSSLIEERIMETRQRVLRHFGVSGREGEHGDEQQEHDEYFVIFTSGATGAIKLVCDMFPWQTSTGIASTLCYTENIHTSVLGMREFAPKAYMLPSSNFLLQQQQTQAGSDNKSSSTSHYCENNRDKCLPLNLFAYPGESNFDGSKMDMYAVGSWLRSMEREDSTLLDPQHRAVLTKKTHVNILGKVDGYHF